MIRLGMKKYNIILIEKELKYQPYHQVKFVNMNILEDILPSNQQQIIEQAKFTYSPSGKAFEKQIKIIEDQGKKQVDALKVLEPKGIEKGSNNKPVITQEFYHKIIEERMGEVLEMRNKIDFNNLIYNFKGPTSSINFGKFGGPMSNKYYGHMKNGDTTAQQVEKQQKDF